MLSFKLMDLAWHLTGTKDWPVSDEDKFCFIVGGVALAGVSLEAIVKRFLTLVPKKPPVAAATSIAPVDAATSASPVNSPNS
jgi:hypothetical protein